VKSQVNSHLPLPEISMEKLDFYRRYFALLRDMNYDIPEELSAVWKMRWKFRWNFQVMQEDFVNIRKTEPELSSDSFHLWMTLARWVIKKKSQKKKPQKKKIVDYFK
jgi:hypothetical protein